MQALCSSATAQVVLWQTNHKLSVYIHRTGDDNVGTAYVQEIRNILQHSAKYMLVDSPVGALTVDIDTYTTDLDGYNAQGQPVSLASTLVTVQTDCSPGVIVINRYTALLIAAKSKAMAADLINVIENDPRFKTIIAAEKNQ